MPVPHRFADFLRAAREKAGTTQAALAAACGLTGSYISLLESGRKPAPSDRVVRRLASALSLDPAEALEVAHLDRAPDDLRRTVDRLRSQAAREIALRERTAEALFPFSIWNLVPGGLSRRGRLAAGPNLEVDLVEAIDHLAEIARQVPDLLTFREESRKVLARFPEEKRRRILAAAPDLVEGTAGPGGRRLIPAPGPALPPDVLPGDTLVVDPGHVPAPGDIVLAKEAGGGVVRRFEKGMADAMVVVEVRRKLK